MRIEFVTGKGGVGKSTQAAALAHAHHAKGHRTLLVELGDHSFFKDYFQMPVVDEVPKASRFGFSVALWSGQTCLREYALHLLKVERLYKLFFENPVSHALIQAAPALAELSILGKITSGPPRNIGPRMPFDVIIVDAYASGHFEALLRAPQSMAEIIKVGPMGTQSRSITEVLKNHDICRYHIITLAEELPLRESLELREQIQALVGGEPRIYVNRWFAELETTQPWGEGNFAWSEDFRAKQARQQNALKLLGQDIRRLPFIFEVAPAEIVEKLSHTWLQISPVGEAKH